MIKNYKNRKDICVAMQGKVSSRASYGTLAHSIEPRVSLAPLDAGSTFLLHFFVTPSDFAQTALETQQVPSFRRRQNKLLSSRHCLQVLTPCHFSHLYVFCFQSARKKGPAVLPGLLASCTTQPLLRLLLPYTPYSYKRSRPQWRRPCSIAASVQSTQPSVTLLTFSLTSAQRVTCLICTSFKCVVTRKSVLAPN